MVFFISSLLPCFDFVGVDLLLRRFSFRGLSIFIISFLPLRSGWHLCSHSDFFCHSRCIVFFSYLIHLEASSKRLIFGDGNAGGQLPRGKHGEHPLNVGGQLVFGLPFCFWSFWSPWVCVLLISDSYEDLGL